MFLINMFLLCSFLVKAQDAEQEFKKVEYPTGYTERLNTVYKQVNGWDGKMDLYLPAKEKGRSPVIINIHGGGWNKGSKESQTGFNTFFKRGYAVANIAYRLVQVAPAPAAIEDVRCALIYLIKNADELNIDVNKIIIMGGSAGGHLALMGGLLDNDNLFDKDCMGTVKNVKVAAIIDKYGITDVSAWSSKSAPLWLKEKAKDANFIKSVSPINYVKKTSPPVFIVHGDADPIVPYQQSVDLYKKLQSLGVKSEFMTIEGGLHGKFPSDKNSELNKRIVEFLKGLGL